MPKNIKIAIWIVLILMIWGTISNIYSKSKTIYNTTVSFKNKYKAIEEKQVSNFDMNFLAFKEKTTVANINKEAFIQVTQIIMSNRKDGENLAWKWTQENTNIPYEEFTSFYKELSSFVSTRYSEQLQIEMEKQNIVNDYNTLLETYPNNVYNYFLNISPMEYKHGFVTDSTSKLFNLKK